MSSPSSDSANAPRSRADSMRVRVVCFDLGGVVVRICRSWSEGCAEAGIRNRLEGEPTLRQQRAIAQAANLHQTGRIALAEFAEACSSIFDDCFNAHEVAAIHHAWLRGEYDGVEDVVASLEQSAVEVALLSNTSNEHWQRLTEYPTIRRIARRFTSHELGVCKPDPAIYQALEASVPCRPEEILYFDDLAPNIDTARDRGWLAHLIDPLQPTSRQIRSHLQRYGVLNGVDQ